MNKHSIIVIITASVFSLLALASVFVSQIDTRHDITVKSSNLQVDPGNFSDNILSSANKLQVASLDEGKIEAIGDDSVGPPANDFIFNAATSRQNQYSLSPGGKYLATISNINDDYSNPGSKNIWLYDLKTNKKISYIETGEDTGIISLAFNKNGESLEFVTSRTKKNTSGVFNYFRSSALPNNLNSVNLATGKLSFFAIKQDSQDSYSSNNSYIVQSDADNIYLLTSKGIQLYKGKKPIDKISDGSSDSFSYDNLPPYGITNKGQVLLNKDSDGFELINLITKEVVNMPSATSYGQQLAGVSKDGRYVAYYVSDYSLSELIVYDTQTSDSKRFRGQDLQNESYSSKTLTPKSLGFSSNSKYLFLFYDDQGTNVNISIDVEKMFEQETGVISIEQMLQFNSAGMVSKYSYNQGYIVGEIYPTSLAEKAGLRSGDIITRANDIDLAAFVPSSKVSSGSILESGVALNLIVLRNNEKITITVPQMSDAEQGFYSVEKSKYEAVLVN
ncbi:MAG: PDZ domain-containing protein [bacterium]